MVFCNLNFYFLYFSISIERPHRIFAPMAPFSINAPLIKQHVRHSLDISVSQIYLLLNQTINPKYILLAYFQGEYHDLRKSLLKLLKNPVDKLIVTFRNLIKSLFVSIYK